MKNSSSITSAAFGQMPDGRTAEIFTLTNAKGARARITNYGGTVVSLEVPDKNGKLGDVVLGCDSLQDYFRNVSYLGCLVGRYGNRIAGGRFILDGKSYKLAQNNGPNSLHGGLKGFDKILWDASPAQSDRGPSLRLHYLSRDGEEGFPGNLDVTAIYTFTDENALELEFTATTDKPTIVNLTHHSYFNLAGRGDVLDHEVMIAADKFTPVDETLIPTGELRPLKGSPLDFSTPTKIGARIDGDDPQLKFGKGYDHNYVLNKSAANNTELVARVYEPTTGRVMEVLTSEPGLQFYSGNYLDGSITGKRGWVYRERNGFCMEPQHFPDSPNKPNFPSTVLRPGEKFSNVIIYRFSSR